MSVNRLYHTPVERAWQLWLSLRVTQFRDDTPCHPTAADCLSQTVRQPDLMAQLSGDILWSIQYRPIDHTSQAVALQHPTHRQQRVESQGVPEICYRVI